MQTSSGFISVKWVLGLPHWGMKLTTHLHIMLRLRMCGNIPLLLHIFSRHARLGSPVFSIYFDPVIFTSSDKVHESTLK
jgi:hypothetical protein